MRFFYLIFFLLLGIHSQFVFSDVTPQCTNSAGGTSCTINAYTGSCSPPDRFLIVKSCTGTWGGVQQSGNIYSCYRQCSCPEGYRLNTILNGSSGLYETGCVPDVPDEGEECSSPNVKNIETGACEPKTECEYPLLYDFYSNSCFNNPNFCAEGTKPNPLEPGTCISYGDESCPSGWIPINDGLNCAPDPNASSSAPGASSAPPASSSGNVSSSPSSNPSSSGGGGDDSGDGDGGGGGTGPGGNNGNSGSGNGSASSSNSSGAGSGNGSGGSGQCDPTAPNYLKCISEDTGGDGDGLGDIDQKEYSLNIAERLQQARDDYTERLNAIKDDLASELSVSLGAGSGSLPRDQVALYGETVEMGIYARKDFFDAVRWVFLAVASVLSLYIILSKGH